MLHKLKKLFKNKEVISEKNEVKDPLTLFSLFEKYKKARDFPNAIFYLEQACSYDPANLQYKLILSTLYLHEERFKEGWELYEHRFDFLPDMYVKQPIPRWQGEHRKGQKIIVFLEQGFGDCLMFARFLPLLKGHFSWIALCTTKELAPLFKKDNLGIDEIILTGDGNVHNYDCYCQLLSLPYLLERDTKERLSRNYDYLKDKFNPILSSNKKIKVGICFHGRLDTDFEKNRAFDLNLIQTIFNNTEYEFHSFYSPQIYKDTYDKLVKDNKIIEHPEMFKDFSKTAELIQSMDFMITTDTAIAHLSGALGKPMHLLLPKLTDWRWQVNANNSYWYPNAIIHRQNQEHNWNDVALEIINIIK